MARAVETDPFHDFRFHLVDPLGGNLNPVAGFTTVQMPNVTTEVPTYREGVFVWTQKFPGVPTVGDVVCTTGIFRRDSDFYKWILKCINGGEDYRADLALNEYHIADEFGINGQPGRVTRLQECFPSDVKPTSDKDSSSSAVSIASMTLACERLEPQVVPIG